MRCKEQAPPHTTLWKLLSEASQRPGSWLLPKELRSLGRSLLPLLAAFKEML